MNRRKWVLLAAGLGIMVLMVGVILRMQWTRKLGNPGVRMAEVTGTNRVDILFPATFEGCQAREIPIHPEELGALPQDTSFGRRLFTDEDGLEVMATVVLMGTDRTSLHKPQFCLTGQGWEITSTEEVAIPMAEPHPYDLPVMKLNALKSFQTESGPQLYAGVYLYWFVAENRLTARHGTRMLWMAESLLASGVLERWAYVSYFATCAPGQEALTYERMRAIIQKSVPGFQTTAGPEAPTPAAGVQVGELRRNS